jgi:DNA-binding ferritin-like protein
MKQYEKVGSSKLVQDFNREITTVFLESLIMVKLFHWKTFSYATHKATDDLYSKLNEHFDSFIEILLGKTGSRINLIKQKTLPLKDFTSQEEFVNHIVSLKEYLFGLNDNKAMLLMNNSDLYNIRDSIVGDLNQLLYLLTFK